MSAIEVSLLHTTCANDKPLAQHRLPPSRANPPASVPPSDMRRRSPGSGRSHNAVHADSVRRSEGCRVGQDTRRYMLAAAASTQATVHQLLSRLQTYKTFQPFLSAPAPYRDNSFVQDRCFSGISGLPLGRGSTATVGTSQLWQMVDRVLDTSVAQLLQHNAEGHFIMTLKSTLGLEAPSSIAKLGTVIQSRKATTPAIHDVAGESTGVERPIPGGPCPPTPPPRLHKAAATSPFTPLSALVDRWAVDHPSATAAEVEEQRRAWAVFDQQRQRTGHSFYLQAMQEQLDILQAEQARYATHSTYSYRSRGDTPLWHRLDMSSFGGSGDVLGAFPCGHKGHGAAAQASEDEDSAAKAEAEKQRALWHTFRGGLLLDMGASKVLHETVLNDLPVVSGYLESTDLHDWLHSSWAHRTHRHESAALRIQCAYRVYRARSEVRGLRYERRQAFLVSLSAERESRRVWDVALQVQTEATATASGADSTLEALQFFINKVNAVVAKRRARKLYQQQQDAEIHNYAATRIQALYRGHCTRVFIAELRHPEVASHRERLRCEKCATLIQTCWRRYAAQRQWWRARRAAGVLHRMHRCRVARRKLAERRYERNLAAAKELKKFAAHRIERWYALRLAVRNAIAGAHMAELLMLQRVCRGYQGRRHTQEATRLSRLRFAVHIIEQHRRRVMSVREAIARWGALKEISVAKRTASMRDDAAVTIQRAWRRQRVLHVY
ncbi:hypothetical protein LPMP_171350 [Leishmania panamensis]|uniref:IQ calmodulin-binding protein n=1 Tax=Leishmania panamensis TaxID=5679 RepID=A0A088RMR6_LEIPA|nr:hypothetical protein LPMP_171350 [Leishmania panamensis]AIN97173.1 hypothetical protein LPMP_171350 [Leishmania panamensis]